MVRQVEKVTGRMMRGGGESWGDVSIFSVKQTFVFYYDILLVLVHDVLHENVYSNSSFTLRYKETPQHLQLRCGPSHKTNINPDLV